MPDEQPSLFDPIPPDARRFASVAFETFRPVMEKLKATLSPSGYWWWRSRWYEWVGYKGSDSHAEWQKKHDVDRAFNDVWELFETEFHPYKHGLPSTAKEI